MHKITNALAVLFVFAGFSAASAAEAVIGAVDRCQGACVGIHGDLRESLTRGVVVRRMETVSTGAGGRLELAFIDGSRLTVGEQAEVVLDQFVYNPGGPSLFHAAIVGPFRFISGRLAKGASRAASVTTPFAVLGLRGTDVWGGPLDGINGVLLFEGVVTVSSAGSIAVLSAPGQGTNIAGPGAAPGPVTNWPAAKVARALATVAFQ